MIPETVADDHALENKGVPFRSLTPLAISLFVLATALGWVASAFAGAAAPDRIVFAGSGANLAIMRLLAEAFTRTHPRIEIEVPATIGSSGGIRAVADGAITVALVSRSLRDSEKALGLTLRPYARTAVVIGAHPTVADEGITVDELVQIYRGVKSRWRDGREIVVLTREPGDSSIEILARSVPAFGAAYGESQRARRWTTLFTDQEMNAMLESTPYATGLSDMGAIRAEHRTIKVLKFNGVAPTPENVLGGRYPLVKMLAFVFRQETLPATAKAFMDFVRSVDGATLLKANGYLPAE
jgi:phosphate transport system substrate-binding protein